jgi:hypothetical protein
MDNTTPISVVLPPDMQNRMETYLRAEMAYFGLSDHDSEGAHRTAAEIYEATCRKVAMGLVNLLPPVSTMTGTLGEAIVESRRFTPALNHPDHDAVHAEDLEDAIQAEEKKIADATRRLAKLKGQMDVVKHPKLKRDYPGKRVRTLSDLKNGLGIIPAGSLALIKSQSPKGSSLEIDTCGHCGFKPIISAIQPADIEFVE